jgi:Family of unknown function (DUF5670)
VSRLCLENMTGLTGGLDGGTALALYKTRAMESFIARVCLTGLEKIFNLKEEKTMLWTIIALLVVLWLLGLIGGIGGNLIHLLLFIAAVVLIFQLISGRRVAI